MTAPSGRDRILLAAEEQMALRGVDVSFREIAAAAGQRNNSAVHYHFGSREGLVRAVLELRSAPQEARRLTLLAELETEGHASDLIRLVDLLIRPMCEVPYAAGSTHFARFLAQVRNVPSLADTVFALDQWPAGQIAATRIYRALPHLPAEIRRRRIASVLTVGITFLADHERRWDGTSPLAPGADVVDDLISMTTGMLRAPVRQVLAH